MAEGNGAGGEEYRVDGRKVVMLGVQEHHHGQKHHVGESHKAPGAGLAGKAEPEQASDPEGSGGDKQNIDLRGQKGQRRQLDVLVGVGDVAEQFIGGKTMDPLPNEVGQSQQDQQGHSGGAPAGAKKATLGTEQEAGQQRDEKENGGVLVFDAQASQQTEKQPCAGAGRAVGQAQEDEDRSHPETGLEGVHGDVIGRGEVYGGGKDGGHGQELRCAAAAELPGQKAGEADIHSGGKEAEDANPGGGNAEKHHGQPGLKGRQRRHIHIAPGQMMAAD